MVEGKQDDDPPRQEKVRCDKASTQTNKHKAMLASADHEALMHSPAL
jgi:hypothetical protein